MNIHRVLSFHAGVYTHKSKKKMKLLMRSSTCYMSASVKTLLIFMDFVPYRGTDVYLPWSYGHAAAANNADIELHEQVHELH